MRGGPRQRHDGDDGERRKGSGTNAGGLRRLGGTGLGTAPSRGILRADQERYRRSQEHRGAGGRRHHGRLFPEGVRRRDPLGPSGHCRGGVEGEGENGVRPRPDRGAGETSRRIPAQRGDGRVSAGSRGGEYARDAAAFTARRRAYRLPALHAPDRGWGVRLSPLPATGSPRGGAATPASLRSRIAGSRRPVGTARQMGKGGGPDSPGPCRSFPSVPAMGRLPRDGGGKSLAFGSGGGE